jgi:hypothetical protein
MTFVRMNTHALDELGEAAKLTALPKIASAVEGRARQLAPKRRGMLAKRIRAGHWRGYHIVRAGAPHSHLVHDGTKRHAMTVKRIALRYKKSGALTAASTKRLAAWNEKGGNRRGMTIAPGVIRAGAVHPGARSQPFLADAVDDVSRLMPLILRNAL